MIILLFINLVFASEWTTLEFYPSTWGSRKICEQLGKGKECFEILESTSQYSIKTIQVNDESKPIYSAKSEVEACLNESDCYSKLSKPCEGVSGAGISLCPKCELPKIGFVNEIFTEAYCTELIGYEQKDKQILELDSVKDSEFQALKASKALAQAKEQAINAKLQEIYKGQKAIAMIRASSDAKNLSVAQKKQLISSTKSIIEALNIGSIDVAKDLINSITPDGVIITEADKTSILGFLQ